MITEGVSQFICDVGGYADEEFVSSDVLSAIKYADKRHREKAGSLEVRQFAAA